MQLPIDIDSAEGKTIIKIHIQQPFFVLITQLFFSDVVYFDQLLGAWALKSCTKYLFAIFRTLFFFLRIIFSVEKRKKNCGKHFFHKCGPFYEETSFQPLSVITVQLVISWKVIKKFMQTLCTNRAQFMLPHFVINTPRALGQGLVGVWHLYHFPVEQRTTTLCMCLGPLPQILRMHNLIWLFGMTVNNYRK